MEVIVVVARARLAESSAFISRITRELKSSYSAEESSQTPRPRFAAWLSVNLQSVKSQPS